MSELIDRQAFIENERKLYCEDCDRRKGKKNGKLTVCYEIGEAPCRACWLDDALGDLDDFPTASPWHRVEDELPKDNTWCVFISENKHNFEQYRWIGTYSEEWGFQDDDNFMVDNVKYWMPLPEPPKEDA